MKVPVGILFALTVGAILGVGAQTFCGPQPAGTSSLKAVLLQNLVNATTRHFARTVIGPDGFPPVSVNQQYQLFDLFTEVYGSRASTASVLNSFLDSIYAPATVATTANLDKVIGLIRIGEYDEARAETFRLILETIIATIPAGEANLNAITDEQVALIRPRLDEIYRSIEDDLEIKDYELFLSLAVGTTLSFAIDTTGSMAGEIEDAKTRTTSIIASTAGTINQPIQYVLSPFNDPGYGPLTVTDDPDVITDALNDLRASGGGDFPELALKGIEQALLVSTRRSIVFMITDADALDVDLESRVIALAIIKKIRVVSLITSNLPGPSGFVLYQRIASASGGLVTVTSKDDFDTVTEIFTTLTTQGRIILYNAVDRTENYVKFYVDANIDTVTILLSGAAGSFTFDRVERNATGTVFAVEEVATANGLEIYRLNNTEPGQYTLVLGSVVDYSVEISALSIFGAIPTLFEEVDGELQHRTQPKAGTPAHIFAHMFGDVESASLTSVTLVTTNGTEILTREMNQCGASIDEFRTTDSFILPEDRFFIVLNGVNDGYKFVRVDPCAVSPLVANIDLEKISDLTLDAGETFTVTALLTSDLGTSFVFDLSDPLLYATTIISVPANTTTIRLVITVTIPSDATPGSLSRATLTATPSGSSEFVFTSFNILVRDSGVRCPRLPSGEGSTVTCTSSNNVGSVCTVQCAPEFILDTEENSECLETGVWSVSVLGCRNVGSQTCQATGDPHFVTFDGLPYDFMGTCIYTLVETTFDVGYGSLQPFSILIENQHLGGDTRVSWFKRAFFKIGNDTIQFLQGRRLTFNGIEINAPFSLPSQGLTLERVGGNIQLTTSFGLAILYNGRYNFFVTLSGSYAGRLTGLCGNMNGDTSDDLVLATNSSIIASAVDVGNSFKVGGNAIGCKDGNDDDGIGECAAIDEYRALCGITENECFEECRRELSVPDLVQNCVFDMCITLGELTAIEEAVSQYAERCQGAGYTVCDWRDVLDIPVDCPANSHYEHEGPGCTDTCLNPNQAARCTLPPRSGCVCNEGFVLSGEKCVPLTECGCGTEGRYYESGASFYTPGCEEYCSCASGVLTCTASTCGTGEVCDVDPATNQLGCVPTDSAECQAHGDPHYRTFDGKLYDFQGACKYLLFSGVHPDTGHQLSVLTQNEFRNGVTHVSWLQYVEVSFVLNGYDVTVVMSRTDSGVVATVSGLFNTTFVTRDRTVGNMRITTNGGYLVLRVGSWRVKFNGGDVRVRVPGAFSGRASGLCGDYNGVLDDDFKASNGTLVTDVNMFGQSYQVGDCDTPVPPDPFVCPPEDAATYATVCSVFDTTVSTVFADCDGAVDLATVYADCIYDVCANGGDDSIIESIFMRVLDQCREAEVPLCDARTDAEIPVPVCPENSHFEICTSGCPNTCANPFASTVCDEPVVDGCVCNLGHLWENGACVRQESCGCYPDDRPFVPQGFVESDNSCTFRCACTGPNRWECGEYSCGEEEECLAVGESYQCLVPSAECLVWGSSYVSTFDRRQYNFDGTCTYLALGARGGEGDSWPSFGVLVNRNVELPCGRSGYWAKLSALGEYPLEVELHSQWQYAKFNGLIVYPGSYYKGVKVISQSNFLTLYFEFGLTLRMSVHGGILITVNGQLRGRTGGLCGTFDSNPDNDFIIDEHSTPAVDVVQFGDAWRYGYEEECRGGTREFVCKNERAYDFFHGSHGCGVLTSDIFSECREHVDLIAHQRACVNTLCNGGRCGGGHFIDSLESTVVGFVTECVIRGGLFPVGVRPWSGIRLACPANSHYEEYSTLCQPTCSDRDGSECMAVSQFVTGPDTESCVCDEGYIYSAGECVKSNQCGCLSPTTGLYFKHGECQVDELCKYKCQCRNGEWDCEEEPCRSDQYCGLREGAWACHSTNICKYDNGGCSQNCTSVNGTAVCSCFIGYGLAEDGKTCLKATSSCSTILTEWRESYIEWRQYYQYEWTKVFADWKSGKCASSADLPHGFTFPGESRSMCNVAWTEWIDTDNATGCGDDESLERIRYMHPDVVCANPIAVDRTVVFLRAPITGPLNLSLNSASEGVLCDNSKQPEGSLCPDFAVRFLCEV